MAAQVALEGHAAELQPRTDLREEGREGAVAVGRQAEAADAAEAVGLGAGQEALLPDPGLGGHVGGSGGDLAVDAVVGGVALEDGVELVTGDEAHLGELGAGDEVGALAALQHERDLVVGHAREVRPRRPGLRPRLGGEELGQRGAVLGARALEGELGVQGGDVAAELAERVVLAAVRALAPDLGVAVVGVAEPQGVARAVVGGHAGQRTGTPAVLVGVHVHVDTRGAAVFALGARGRVVGEGALGQAEGGGDQGQGQGLGRHQDLQSGFFGPEDGWLGVPGAHRGPDRRCCLPENPAVQSPAEAGMRGI